MLEYVVMVYGILFCFPGVSIVLYCVSMFVYCVILCFIVFYIIFMVTKTELLMIGIHGPTPRSEKSR